MRLRSITLAVLIVVFLSLPSMAHAAYPGANGKIAFVRDNQIWTMNADGSGQTQLTNAASASLDPQWSPDGSKIAYTRGTFSVRVMNADGTGDYQVAPELSHSPSWSPDGRRLVFAQPEWDEFDCVCYLYWVVATDLDGSHSHRMPAGFPMEPVEDIEVSALDRLAFTGYDPMQGDGYVWVTRPAGGLTLIDGDRCCYTAFGAAWAPGGTRLAYIRDVYASGVKELYTRDDDASDLVHVEGIHPHGVEWSPGGTRLVFSEGDLFTSNPDGSSRTQLTSTVATEQSPDWQPVVSGTRPAGYPRPQGATPVRVPLVPAYRACTTPNSAHGSPLAFPSCAPPAQSSSHLTIGTQDANGAAENASGFMRLAVRPGSPDSPADEADVRLSLQMSDVRCQTGNGSWPCVSTNDQGGSDYQGHLHAHFDVRLTDRYNLPAPAGNAPGTVEVSDVFSVLAGCIGTTDTTVGSTCSVETSVDAIRPATVREGKRAVWGIGQIQVFDEQGELFLTQGLFVP